MAPDRENPRGSAPIPSAIPVDRIGLQALPVLVDADAETRGALAQRLGMPAVEVFRAEGAVRRRRDTGWIEFKGTLTARVVQECVVSLEPIEGTVEVAFTEVFDDRPDSEHDDIDVDVDPTSEEPEPLLDGILDVHEVLAQTLAVSLDPYPRKPGLSAAQGTPEDSDVQDSPFAKLALLKDRGVKKR